MVTNLDVIEYLIDFLKKLPVDEMMIDDSLSIMKTVNLIHFYTTQCGDINNEKTQKNVESEVSQTISQNSV